MKLSGHICKATHVRNCLFDQIPCKSKQVSACHLKLPQIMLLPEEVSEFLVDSVMLQKLSAASDDCNQFPIKKGKRLSFPWQGSSSLSEYCIQYIASHHQRTARTVISISKSNNMIETCCLKKIISARWINEHCKWQSVKPNISFSRVQAHTLLYR